MIRGVVNARHEGVVRLRVRVPGGAEARLRRVRVGHGNGLETEVLEGLAEGDEVILHPSDKIADGVAVRAR